MTAQKRETPLAGGAGANQITQAEIVASAGDENKLVATLIARMALMGHAVYKLADGGYLISRWGMTRYCADPAQLAAFLVQIGGRL